MGGKTIEKTFTASTERVFTACRHAVAELGYSVTTSDSAGGVLSFNTGRSMKTWGGQDLTASVLPSASGSRVVVGGSLGKGGSALTGGGAQLVGWGEKKELSLKFLGAVERILPTIPETPLATPPPPPSQPSQAPPPPPQPSLAAQIKELKQLLDDGVLTAEEFESAKAKLL